jgi:5-methylcytosine-specific restriction endonuclease McrA
MSFSRISWRDFREKEFLEWLMAQGAELLPVLRENDIFAYSLEDKTSGVRETHDGRIRWLGKAFAHYCMYLTETGQNVEEPPPAQPVDDNVVYGDIKRDEVIRRLKKRDGCGCFFCGRTIPRGRETIEHLLPKAASKSKPEALQVLNNLRNLALAHQNCNAQAGSLSLVEKVKLRDKLRSAANVR